jgi:uncharacterized protein YggU (UPF0235/DUF167 family)
MAKPPPVPSDPSDITDVVSVFAEGVRVTVKARPGISRARAPRLVDIGDGKRALEITVAAAAEDGKANQAICEQLADCLGLKKNALAIKAGTSGRLKIVEITGDPAVLQQRLRTELYGFV